MFDLTPELWSSLGTTVVAVADRRSVEPVERTAGASVCSAATPPAPVDPLRSVGIPGPTLLLKGTIMAALTGTLDQSLEEAIAAVRRVAAGQGYSFAEAESGPNLLVFKKGASAFSWGSRIRVNFEATSPTQTRLFVATKETWAIADWGRGNRAAHRLLEALGANA